MTVRALHALKKAIAKYVEKSQAPNGVELKFGAQNCPLCLLYFNKGCRGCPVRARTGFIDCVGTPYNDIAMHFKTRMSPELRPFVEAELEFLKSLLPARRTPCHSKT